MNWGTIAWIVIVGLGFLAMTRGCGGGCRGMMGGMRGGGCGMPRHRGQEQPPRNDKTEATDKAA